MLVELIQRGRIKGWARLWLRLLRYYFRVEVEGMDYVPDRGRALIVANHSGFAGADALLLAHLIKRGSRRRARLLAHRAFFDLSPKLRAVSEYFGLKRASIPDAIEMLKQDRLVIIFPEGERGNFKSTIKRYRLRPFHTGFLRMAIESRAPIIPCVIIGAEEAHLNFGNINLSKMIKGLRIPLPVNFVPLPSKWKLVFLPPIRPDEVDSNPESLQLEAQRIQKILQGELGKQVKARPYIYTRKSRELLNRVKRKVFI